MNKYLVRITALLLVPFLVADPVTVSAMAPRPHLFGVRTPVAQLHFAQEAVAPPDAGASFSHPFAPNVTAGIDRALEEQDIPRVDELFRDFQDETKRDNAATDLLRLAHEDSTGAVFRAVAKNAVASLIHFDSAIRLAARSLILNLGLQGERNVSVDKVQKTISGTIFVLCKLVSWTFTQDKIEKSFRRLYGREARMLDREERTKFMKRLAKTFLDSAPVSQLKGITALLDELLSRSRIQKNKYKEKIIESLLEVVDKRWRLLANRNGSLEKYVGKSMPSPKTPASRINGSNKSAAPGTGFYSFHTAADLEAARIQMMLVELESLPDDAKVKPKAKVKDEKGIPLSITKFQFKEAAKQRRIRVRVNPKNAAVWSYIIVKASPAAVYDPLTFSFLGVGAIEPLVHRLAGFGRMLWAMWHNKKPLVPLRIVTYEPKSAKMTMGQIPPQPQTLENLIDEIPEQNYPLKRQLDQPRSAQELHRIEQQLRHEQILITRTLRGLGILSLSRPSNWPKDLTVRIHGTNSYISDPSARLEGGHVVACELKDGRILILLSSHVDSIYDDLLQKAFPAAILLRVPIGWVYYQYRSMDLMLESEHIDGVINAIPRQASQDGVPIFLVDPDYRELLRMTDTAEKVLKMLEDQKLIKFVQIPTAERDLNPANFAVLPDNRVLINQAPQTVQRLLEQGVRQSFLQVLPEPLQQVPQYRGSLGCLLGITHTTQSRIAAPSTTDSSAGRVKALVHWITQQFGRKRQSAAGTIHKDDGLAKAA